MYRGTPSRAIGNDSGDFFGRRSVRQVVATLTSCFQANASETDEPDERRDTKTMTTATTSIAIEEETVDRVSRRRKVERVTTVSAARDDSGATDTAVLTGRKYAGDGSS